MQVRRRDRSRGPGATQALLDAQQAVAHTVVGLVSTLARRGETEHHVDDRWSRLADLGSLMGDRARERHELAEARRHPALEFGRHRRKERGATRQAEHVEAVDVLAQTAHDLGDDGAVGTPVVCLGDRRDQGLRGTLCRLRGVGGRRRANHVEAAVTGRRDRERGALQRACVAHRREPDQDTGRTEREAREGGDVLRRRRGIVPLEPRLDVDPDRGIGDHAVLHADEPLDRSRGGEATGGDRLGGHHVPEPVGCGADHRPVAFRGREQVEELGRRREAEPSREIDRARRVAQDLAALDPARLVEEPAAARVHEQPGTLDLEQHRDPGPLGIAQAAPRVPLDQRGKSSPCAVRKHPPEVVAQDPGIGNKCPGLAFEPRVDRAGERIEGGSQSGPPALVPSLLAAGATAAIRSPALDAVCATPRRALDDLDLVGGRMLREVSGVVRHPDPRFRESLDRHCERHLAEAMVMSVGLAVGREVHQLRPGPVVEGRQHPAGERVAAVQHPFEGDAASEARVIEEERDRATRGQPAQIGPAGVDRGARHVGPVAAAERTDARGLVRREDGEGDAASSERLEAPDVDGGLGQPHALGGTTEAVLEVGEPPSHLGQPVAVVRERHDQVIVGLSDCVAAPAESPRALTVGGEHGRVDVGPGALQPRKECRTEVEAHRPVVVADAHDTPGGIERARVRVRRVALGVDPLVPVVERGRARLARNGLQPGILPRRLVEVPVDDREALVGAHRTHSPQPSAGAIRGCAGRRSRGSGSRRRT